MYDTYILTNGISLAREVILNFEQFHSYGIFFLFGGGGRVVEEITLSNNARASL